MNEAAHCQLKEKAYPGLHDELYGVVRRFASENDSVLDCGCGTGAWLARLQKEGFSKVKGIDAAPQEFGLDSSLFVHADLDRPFAHKCGQRFDVITVTEVIEHLENPTNFLRELRGLIANDGLVFITTPNVHSTPERLRFLRRGYFGSFESLDPTHVSPILSTLFSRIASNTGWRVRDCVPLLVGLQRQCIPVRVLCKLLNPFLAGACKGDCVLYVLAPSVA